MCHLLRPLAAWPLRDRAGIAGVLCDIDDTLTSGGAIAPAALQALRDLAAAGLPAIAITGRPMGWSQPYARSWPVRAIVAENGAVALIPEAGGVQVEYLQDEATRAANALRLRAAAEDILRGVPGAQLAQDSAGRVTDIAVDHAEHAQLDGAGIEQVLMLMLGHGMRASVSSIHVNGWYGEHDKWQGACWIVRRLFGRELAAETQRWMYVGDSGNDQVMFERLPQSIGVANVMRYADGLEHPPAYVTPSERGEGFAEAVAALLAARGA